MIFFIKNSRFRQVFVVNNGGLLFKAGWTPPSPVPYQVQGQWAAFFIIYYSYVCFLIYYPYKFNIIMVWEPARAKKQKIKMPKMAS